MNLNLSGAAKKLLGRLGKTNMQELFSGIYKNRKVLVTGHTGFKGSWLTAWLTQMGANVSGYSLEPNTNPAIFNILKLQNNINHTIADIRDYESLTKAINNFKPEIIFHMAAQPLVRYSYKHPRYTYETNVMGTVNLLEAARNCDSVKVFINVTSDKCYENIEKVYAYKETDRFGGHDPYSNSKGASELITSAYRNIMPDIAVASGRAGNVIGGGDWSEDRLIPDCVRAISNNQEIIIRNPNATRPWQHVLEPISGYLHLASVLWQNPDKYTEGWNFGPEHDSVLPVGNVVSELINLWGQGSYKVVADNKMHEAGLLMLDITKAKQNLNWQPVYTIQQALNETVSWYKDYYAGGNLIELTEKQISNYIKTAQKKNISWSITNEKVPG